VVQRNFRQFFTTWGRPRIVRVDNGSPWGSSGDLPPDLALWLFGLELEMLWNPPRQPQANGVVERSQGVARNWAEPQRCRSVRHLQRRINHEDRLQREEYPSLDGQPRIRVYPELRHSGRDYSRDWERRHWNWSRVCSQLAGHVVRRRVDCCGKLGVYHHKLYVGSRHKGRDVYVQLDPERIEWVVSDAHGHQLHRSPAEMLTPQRVRQLQVSKHEPTVR
jgi:hypothetical protein